MDSETFKLTYTDKLTGGRQRETDRRTLKVHRQTDRCTERRTDRQTDGQKDAQKYG